MAGGKKKGKRWLKALLGLVLAAALGFAGWSYLAPLVLADSVTTYQAYTVGQGEIRTDRSFSASMAVRYSESYSSTSADSQIIVRELYVVNGQEVKKGDPIMTLSTGESFTAGLDGVGNELRVEKGSWARRGMTLASVCDLTHLQVSMPVDEYDVESLAVGTACAVTVTAPGRTFETEIAHINRVSASSFSVAYYTVTANLNVPEDILPGMACTVSIPADTAENVTTLEMAALAFDEDKAPYVLRRAENGAYERVTVQTGLSDGMTVEIVAGLTPGETVYAVSGTESAAPRLTLAELYKSVFGETVIINDKSGSGRGGQGSGKTSQDIDLSSLPEGFDASSLPEGFTPPSGAAGETGGMSDEGNQGE